MDGIENISVVIVQINSFDLRGWRRRRWRWEEGAKRRNSRKDSKGSGNFLSSSCERYNYVLWKFIV